VATEVTLILRWEGIVPDDEEIEQALDCVVVERIDEEEV